MAERTYNPCEVEDLLDGKYLGQSIEVRGIARGVVYQPSPDIPDYIGNGQPMKHLDAVDFYALLQKGERFIELWGNELLTMVPSLLKASSESNIEVIVKGIYMNKEIFQAIQVEHVEFSNVRR